MYEKDTLCCISTNQPFKLLSRPSILGFCPGFDYIYVSTNLLKPTQKVQPKKALEGQW
ncbi:hypothetical protein DsansV1_C14g0128901 [Dioscorea sansibarensis]